MNACGRAGGGGGGRVDVMALWPTYNHCCTYVILHVRIFIIDIDYNVL